MTIEFESELLREMVSLQADLWGLEGEEYIHRMSLLDVLIEALDDSPLLDLGPERVRERLDAGCQGFSIEAYKREPITQNELLSWGISMTEHLREMFGEEHGDQDGDDRLQHDDEIELQMRCMEIAKWYVGRVQGCSVELLKAFQLQPSDMRELVQKLRPEWLGD